MLVYSVNYVVIGAPQGRIVSSTSYFEEDKVVFFLRNIQKECNIDDSYTLAAYAHVLSLDENWELGKDITDDILRVKCIPRNRLPNLSPLRPLLTSADEWEGAVTPESYKELHVIILASVPQGNAPESGNPLNPQLSHQTPAIGNTAVEKPKSARLLGLSILHEILWEKNGGLVSRVFQKASYPRCDIEGKPISRGKFECTILTLTDLLSEYFGTNGKPHGFYDDSLLPSRAHALVVRQAYEDMDPILTALQAGQATWPDKPPGILLTGNPGIGKTHYLSYVLVKCLLQGRRVIYQDEDDTFYLFSKNGVTAYTVGQIKAFAHENDIWALFDMKPPRFIVRTRWFVIHVSSPLVDNYKYWVKQRAGVMYYLSTWSWEEIQAAVRLKIPGLEQPAEGRVMAMMGRLYDRYGPIPRLLLNELRNLTSWGFKFDETLEEHEVRLAVKLAQFLERYTTMGPEDSIGMSGSHAVLIIVPICLGKVVNVSRSCYTTLASRHIGVELAMVAARKYREKGRLLFDDIAEVPQAHQERMFFWEGLAHYALERWLASPKAIINLGSKSPCLNFQWEQRPTSQKSVPTTLQDVALAWEGAHFHLNPISSVGVPHTEWAPGLVFSTNSYLRLERKSASTFDGIAITEESIQPTGSVDTIIGAQKILLFQMFREGGNNDVRTEGFQRLLSALPPRFQQASICLIWITRTTEYPSPQVLAAAHGILFPDKNVFKARTGSWQYMLRAPAVDKIWT